MAPLPDLPPFPESLAPLRWILPVATVLGGAVLWTLGRWLARPAGALFGLLAGGAGGLGLVHLMESAEMRLAGIALLALVGALVCWLFFRLWIAVILALVLAILAPGTSFLMRELPDAPAADSLLPARSLTLPTGQAPGTPEAGPGETEPEPEPEPGQLGKLRRWMASAARALATGLLDHWEAQETATRRTLVVAGIAGAVTGLLLGLIAPWFAASVTTAALGTFALLAGMGTLTHRLLGEGNTFLPERPAGLLLLLLLGTALGSLIQILAARTKRKASG